MTQISHETAGCTQPVAYFDSVCKGVAQTACQRVSASWQHDMNYAASELSALWVHSTCHYCYFSLVCQ